MLPYVPTILASVLVLFLGIELTIEALWEPAKSTVFSEWLIIMTTLVACTFLGFAPGFGVGMGAAVVVYLLWGIIDTVFTRLQPHDGNDLTRNFRGRVWLPWMKIIAAAGGGLSLTAHATTETTPA